ncbi:neutral zinc metallopeptidase [Sporichthya brevicatena]|uniref:Neutral zinc metallopeptidase n=1 Tax=Sporichthya brevicatena TaxID=171442 RepID=A0ABP3SAE0_9ACTN
MIKFDDSSVDASGVRDRRGKGSTAAIGGGGVGIVGLLVYALFSVLGGGGSGLDPSLLFPADGSVQSKADTSGDLQTRCNTEGAIEKYDDCYLVKVYNEINEVWTDDFARRGERYERPALTFFETAVSTGGCGRASSQVGPFYCPGDESIYIDIGFLAELQRQFGAAGRYAQAYILAHEAGHHIQTMLGTEDRMRQEQRSSPKRKNELSVAFELQADCYAGVWSRLADDAGNVSVSEDEVREAQAAAAAVGDDRIQQKSTGRVDPESWTHGSAAQRERWFTTGRDSGNLNACDTFA